MNMIAGLYKKREQAFNAYRALHATGFQKQDLTMLVRKQVRPPDFSDRASAGDLARSAGIGAIVIGVLGGILGLLVGEGLIPVARWLPSLETGTSRMVINLAVSGLVIGAWIGGLLGAVTKLTLSDEQTAITDEGVKRGGLLLVVNADETQETTAQVVLEENGAADVENLSDTWDREVWSRYKGIETL
jgi:hypothetical protein